MNQLGQHLLKRIPRMAKQTYILNFMGVSFEPCDLGMQRRKLNGDNGRIRCSVDSSINCSLNTSWSQMRHG